MLMEMDFLSGRDGIHRHCFACIKIWKCTMRPQQGESCEIMSCDLDCGARFHSCKKTEHRLLCANEKVPCINKVNGCPAWIVRRQISSHLETCPASVVHCTMEWNRWPVHSRDHQITKQPHQPQHQTQLDVALALRDQRMLSQWWRAPRRTRRTFRNPLTRKYPAVPLCACRQSSGSGEAGNNELSRCSNHSELCMCPEDSKELPKKLVCFVNDTVVSEISAACLDDRAQKDVNPQIAGTMPPSPPVAPSLTVALGLDLNLQSITRYQPKPKSMYTFLCAQEFRRDEYAWHYKNVHSDIHGGLNGWLEQRCPLAQYGCMFSQRRLYPAPRGSVIVHNDTLESFGVQPPPFPVKSEVVDRLKKYDIARRSTGRSCNMPWQQRGSMTVNFEYFDKLLSRLDASSSMITPLEFIQLPFEILQHIARCLDSFSLCNLSLTSRLLREVCHSLLEERGLVVFQWERQKIGTKYSWQIVYKRWFFSTACTPITQWCFQEDNNMANHLQTCMFFNRNARTFPYLVGGEPNESVYRKLKESLGDFAPTEHENVTTKL